jgi:hypothetical protein
MREPKVSKEKLSKMLTGPRAKKTPRNLKVGMKGSKPPKLPKAKSIR